MKKLLKLNSSLIQYKKAKTAIKYWTKSISPQCIILMWLPWTGKSYSSHYLNEKHGYTILSWENITHAIFGTEKCSWTQYWEAYEILNILAQELVQDWYKIVIDSTNLKKIFRSKINESLSAICNNIFWVYLYINDDIAFKRANSRGLSFEDSTNILSSVSRETFASFKEQLELPSKEENFFMVESNENLFKTLDIVINENKK